MKTLRALAGFAALAIIAATAPAQAKTPPTRVRFVNTVASSSLYDATLQNMTLDTKPRRLAKQTGYTQTTPLRKVKNPGSLEIAVTDTGAPVVSGTVSVPAGNNTAVMAIQQLGNSNLDLVPMSWTDEFVASTGLVTVVNAMPDVAQVDLHFTSKLGSFDYAIPHASYYSGRWSPVLHVTLTDHSNAQVLAELDVTPQPKDNQMVILAGTAYGADDYPVVVRVINRKSKK